MKALIHSNAPWVGTGYGQQTEQLAKRMLADGHEVTVSAFFGLSGTSMVWDGIRVLPGGYDAFGNDVLEAHALRAFDRDPHGGWVLTLTDVWTLRAPSLRDLKIASWVPIDHAPVPPEVLAFFRRTSAVPIAMSLFGQEQMAAVGLPSLYAPHGIDTAVFQPTDTLGSKPARKALGLPDDAFVVLINSANKGASPPRKAFPQMFRAFADFARTRSDALLYLHTDTFGHADGMDLRALAIACGIEWERQVRAVDQYGYRAGLPAEVVAATYTAADVLLCTSLGEGFGIPVVEAQACGTPVIVSDFSAQPELCGAGWTVPGEPLWDHRQMAWWQVPDIGCITTALAEAYEHAAGMGDKARAFAVQYDANLIYDRHWRPILERLEMGPEAPALEVA